jgi:hypothetical protein
MNYDNHTRRFFRRRFCPSQSWLAVICSLYNNNNSYYYCNNNPFSWQQDPEVVEVPIGPVRTSETLESIRQTQQQQQQQQHQH